MNSVGSFIRNYTVEGSKETELLRQFYQAFVGGAQRLDNIAGQFARTNLSEEERKALVKEYTDEYYRIRREQLRFIIENKSSLAAVYALYQRLPGDTYLFNGDSDVVYYRTVAEALEQSYPDSPYLQSLLAEITRMDARISLTSRISEAGYPDPGTLGHLRQEGAALVADGQGRAVGLLVGRTGQQQYAQCRAEGGLQEIRRRSDAVRGLSGGRRFVETPLDHRRAGAAAALDLGERSARSGFDGAPALQRAETSGQFPDRPGGHDRGQGYLRQES